MLFGSTTHGYVVRLPLYIARAQDAGKPVIDIFHLHVMRERCGIAGQPEQTRAPEYGVRKAVGSLSYHNVEGVSHGQPVKHALQRYYCS